MAAGTKRRRQRNRQQAEQPVAEIIGRATYGTVNTHLFRSRGLVAVDETRTDYAFYDLLRRGKQPGYKLGALFAKRIEHIFAVWTLGRGVSVKLAEGGPDGDANDARNLTDAALERFLQAIHATLITLKEDALGLGDQFIFVNADGTLSIPSPDTVEETRDPFDYRTVTAVTITTALPTMTVVDEYTLQGRTVTWKKGTEVVRVSAYANLIGRLPYIRIAHGQSGNDLYGHSIHEDLLKLYDQYDDVVHKQLDGAKLLGNPLLAISGLEDLSAVIDANKPAVNSTYNDRDGNLVTRPELNLDSNSILLIGKGGSAGFVAPPVGFTADTQQALKTLFLLLMDRTGIPEFIWGNELSSARASSDTQLLQWAHDIEGMQRTDERWLMELCEIWLAWQALTDPQMVQDELQAEWPPVLDENMELRLKTLEFASNKNLLTAKTTLELTELPVEDAGDQVEKAQAEAQERADAAQERMAAQGQGETEGDNAPTDAAGVGEMTEREVGAIVAGAIRIVAGAHNGA
jgi:hypothetical protein